MLVIEKTIWEDGDIDYNITVQDARYDHSCGTLWGRLKGAVKILFGKPVYYNEVHFERAEDFQKLVEDMERLSKSNLDEERM